MKKGKLLCMLCSAVLLGGCGKATESSSEREKTVKKELPKQITLDNMPPSAETECNSDGLLKKIEGNFVDFAVNNEDDAFKAVASVSELMKCNDIENEVRFFNVVESSANTIYSFRQYYNDVPIDGYATLLFVDGENNKVRRLKNSYIPDISVDTTPTFTEDDLKKFVTDKYKTDIDGEPELEISFLNYTSSNTPSLIWKTELSESSISSLIVDAASGDVLYEEEPQY